MVTQQSGGLTTGERGQGVHWFNPSPRHVDFYETMSMVTMPLDTAQIYLIQIIQIYMFEIKGQCRTCFPQFYASERRFLLFSFSFLNIHSNSCYMHLCHCKISSIRVCVLSGAPVSYVHTTVILYICYHKCLLNIPFAGRKERIMRL